VEEQLSVMQGKNIRGCAVGADYLNGIIARFDAQQFGLQSPRSIITSLLISVQSRSPLLKGALNPCKFLGRRGNSIRKELINV
jgi:hypothetical protein